MPYLDEFPKLRPLDMKCLEWEGQPGLFLRDPLRLSERTILVPRPAVPLLVLCDGTRDLAALRRGFALHTGINLPQAQVESFIETLDEALLLDNRRCRVALQNALDGYHSAPFRTPSLAGHSYPEDALELRATLEGYSHKAGLPDQIASEHVGRIVGIISPHIDFMRGWRSYARTWQAAKAAVEEAQLVILLGTDHSGSPGS